MAANPEVHGKAGGREPREGATRGALTPVPPASPQLRGTTVRLTATVQPKVGDPTFGYYSRPAKAEVLAPAPAAEVAA